MINILLLSSALSIASPQEIPTKINQTSVTHSIVDLVWGYQLRLAQHELSHVGKVRQFGGRGWLDTVGRNSDPLVYVWKHPLLTTGAYYSDLRPRSNRDAFMISAAGLNAESNFIYQSNMGVMATLPARLSTFLYLDNSGMSDIVQMNRSGQSHNTQYQMKLAQLASLCVSALGVQTITYFNYEGISVKSIVPYKNFLFGVESVVFGDHQSEIVVGYKFKYLSPMVTISRRGVNGSISARVKGLHLNVEHYTSSTLSGRRDGSSLTNSSFSANLIHVNRF